MKEANIITITIGLALGDFTYFIITGHSIGHDLAIYFLNL